MCKIPQRQGMTPILRHLMLSTALGAMVLLAGCDRPKEKPPASDDFVEVEPIYLSPSVAGNYLAGRFAVGRDDLSSATQFYEFAIASAKAEDKEFLIERALPTSIGAGEFDKALKLARQVDLEKPLATSQLALTVLLVDAFKRNSVDDIRKYLPNLRTDGFGRLLKPLMEVWLSVAENKTAQAFDQLGALTKQYPSLGPLAQMHTAFVYDAADNAEGASRFYAKSLDAHASIRAVWLVAQFYERQKDTEKAIALYSDLAEKMQGSPFAGLIIRRLEEGRLNAENQITDPKHGVAAALYDVATVLHQENSLRLALLYGQLAHMLVPKDPFVNMLLGDIISASSLSDPAEAYYRNIGENSDFHVLAQMRLAQIHESRGDLQKAIALLEGLAEDPIIARNALTEIADIHRRDENFKAAIPYYSKAIETITEPVESDWPLYYARGICYERAKDWDKAEADLQQALKLSPQQPEVLNYLAYSWADSGKNLDQALEMLQNALAGAPDDPYITDSVGWALYKLGRFEDAVPYLEAAVQQLPADPTINDHLGDVYWRVGRRLEARFQWERALKSATEKEAELKDQIRIKLAHGLPSLLAPIEPKKKNIVTENSRKASDLPASDLSKDEN